MKHTFIFYIIYALFIQNKKLNIHNRANDRLRQFII